MKNHVQKNQKHLKLSQKGKVAVLMTLAGLSSSAMAQITAVDSSLVQVDQQNNVDIINIAKPNAAGLSHNQFENFDVSTSGAVMNNALDAGTSKLAGNLDANANFEGDAASVILNEVISRNPSLVLGEQEVFGIAADYVLANPNGITCNGCGFINTPRASLVVGLPTVDGNKLTGFDVTNNNQLTANGKINAEEVLNLIAPQITVDGDINAEKAVNIIFGSNTLKITENGLEAEQQATGAVLDAKLLGSIQSGAIRIHTEDSRGSVDATAVDWDADSLIVNAGNVNIDGKTSKTTTDLSDDSKGSKRGVTEDNKSTYTQEEYQGSTLDADSILINAQDKLTISGSEINSNNDDAKLVTLTGSQIELTTAKSTNSHIAETKKSKSSWSDEVTKKTYNETLYTPSIEADNIVVVAAEGINAKAAQLDGETVTIKADGKINLGGDIQSYDNTMVHNFKNEGIKLKTGSTLNQIGDDLYVAGSINADNLSIEGKSEVNLKGVKVNTGTAKIESETINLGSEASGETTKKIYQETYWGRMFGATAEKDVVNKTIQNGTEINATDTVALEAKNGITITGSDLAAKNGVVVTADTSVNIESAKEVTETIKGNRKGSLFDITKEEQESWAEAKTNKASDIKSDTNITVVSKDEINIVGSKLAAAGVLTLNANKVNIEAGEEETSSETHQVGWEDPTYAINGINVLDPDLSAKDVIGKLMKKGLKLGADVGIEFFDKKAHVEKTTAVGSVVSGGDVVIGGSETESVVLTGSDVVATTGDVTIEADDITTQAAETVTVTDVNDTTVGIGVSVEVSKKGAKNGVSLDINNTQGTTTETDAAVGSISAENGTVDLDATTISHEGTQITADTVTQDAEEISQTAAESTVESDIDSVDVNLGVTVNGEFTGGISGEVEVGASGGNKKTSSSKAEVTKITGETVEINADNTLVDEGTNYEGGDVTLTADDYENTAAVNTESEVSNSGGVGISVGAGSSDMINVDVEVGVSAEFEHENTQSTEAVQSEINVDNITIEADNSINTEANINASEDVTLIADTVNQNQSENTSTSVSGGFDLEVGVGAVVSVATGGTPIPTIDGSVAAHGGNETSTTGVGTKINAGNVTIEATNGVSLQGTTVEAADSVNISGDEVSITGTTDSSKKLKIQAGVSAEVSEEMSAVGFGGSIGVDHEVTSGGEAVQISGETVNIEAIDDITLVGTTVTGGDVNVSSENGDLDISAINNTKKKNNISAGINLSGSVDEALKIEGGSANLGVDLVDNSTFTDAGIDGTNVTVNADNVALVGANIDADNLAGNISGTLTTENVVDSVNENNVQIDVNPAGSGVELEIDHKKQVSNQTSGVTAAKNNLTVADSNIDNSKVDEVDNEIGLDITIPTSVDSLKGEVISDIVQGEYPLVQVDGVDAPHKEIAKKIKLPVVVGVGQKIQGVVATVIKKVKDKKQK